MTIQKFLSLLKANRNQFDWVLQADTRRHTRRGSERRAAPRFRILGTPREGDAPSVALDPVRAVCYLQTGKTFDSEAWSDVAEALEMDLTAADVLLSAANDLTWSWSWFLSGERRRRRAPSEHLLSIRRRLLEAAGLEIGLVEH